jgi:hypothetical protein
VCVTWPAVSTAPICSFHYERGVSPGNGVYLTSRQENGGAAFSYTATRKFSFSVSGGYSHLDGIGQNLQPYSQLNGRCWGHLCDHQSDPHVLYSTMPVIRKSLMPCIDEPVYRATVGISFSPGDIPLAFH